MNFASAKRNQTGFTLLEILIATIILLSTIGIVTEIYRGALLSSSTATVNVTMSSKVPIIAAQIQQQIRSIEDPSLERASGNGEVFETTYKWEAYVESFRPPIPVFSPESGRMESFPNKFKLWNVKLTVNYKSRSKDYIFKEVSWIL
ncbi:prepilin-type N-terminal cleavage/methylation domain-containing protein [Thalassotalea euphylliae]|uniref:type IV pilus modification PilV family protein n=1 Tax=Thalassotalea euphylliae TaxID=1655234 RepID=UPI00363146CE